MQQSLQTGRLCGLSDSEIKRLFDGLGGQLSQISLNEAPPVMASRLQRIITEMTGVADPLLAVKRESNEAALSYYEEAVSFIDGAEDPLRAAIQVAIAGNIIDYGAVFNLDVDAELERILQQEKERIACEESELFSYEQFKHDLEQANSLLYIGDNAGEIVFDKALIATIQRQYPHLAITFAVRGYPILNDALMEDAEAVGLDSLVKVVSSGVHTPGLMLEYATDEFKELFNETDVIISKGQGNLESLLETPGPIYFLLVAKCQPISRLLGCEIRDIILKRQTLSSIARENPF
mgnify:CR=1 FL=1